LSALVLPVLRSVTSSNETFWPSFNRDNPFYGADVNEHVVAAVIGLDEAISLLTLNQFTLPVAKVFP
jgi:hypothetical protein